MKDKIWSTKKADKMFSEYIRERDGKCLRCGTTKSEPLSCSHFWGRRCAATRYDPSNCISLHLWSCHIYGWEKDKQGAYRSFMLQRLGRKRYRELEQRFYGKTVKMREAVIKCMELLK